MRTARSRRSAAVARSSANWNTASSVSSRSRSLRRSAPTFCRRSWSASRSDTRTSAFWCGPAIQRRSWTSWRTGRSSSGSSGRSATRVSAAVHSTRTSSSWSLRPDHPFAAAGVVDVAEISHAQLILFDRTSSYYDITNALFRVAGVVPRGVTEVDNIEAAKRMVERGLGVALLPGTAVADALSGGSLREIGLAGTAYDPAADRGGRAGRSSSRHRRSWIPYGDSSIGSRS